MRILCIGDVVGTNGSKFLRDKLPGFKKLYQIDAVICNGENSSDGNGITPASARFLFDSGVDVITLGNHTFRRKEFYEELDSNPFIIRPANFPDGTTPGRGMCVLDLGRVQITVINIMGSAFMDTNLDCPFRKIEELLSKVDTKITVVDFHAEATGEKRAMGFFLDGRVSAVYGTHTHIQTSDAQILKNGTGYITDVGMTGPIESVLGVKPEIIISKLKDKLPVRFDYADGDCEMDCVVFDIDEKTGKTNNIESFILK